MTLKCAESYNTLTPVAEAIEIRLIDRNSNRSTYLGWADLDTGTIHHQLTMSNGQSEALSNSSGRSCPDYPRKLVPGWQAEMLAYFEAGYRTIQEVR